MADSCHDLIKKVKQLLQEELVERNDIVKQFSDDVISLAYQKISANAQDMIQAEDDPVVLGEILKNYLEVTKLINDKDSYKHQLLIKYFEQLNKYEQSRYY